MNSTELQNKHYPEDERDCKQYVFLESSSADSATSSSLINGDQCSEVVALKDKLRRPPSQGFLHCKYQELGDGRSGNEAKWEPQVPVQSHYGAVPTITGSDIPHSPDDADCSPQPAHCEGDRQWCATTRLSYLPCATVSSKLCRV